MSLRPLIGVINSSSNVSNDDVVKMVTACQEQLRYDVGPAWERDYWYIIFYPDPSKISPRAYPMVIVDNDSTPGALGWHAEFHDRPYAQIMTSPVLDNGGVVLFDPKNPQNVSVSSVMSHEVVEEFIDPYINLWADGPQIAQGMSYAVEACDPVESSSYNNNAAGVPVSLSNFVLPSYFDNQGTHEKFDYLGRLKAPFTLDSGGYMVVRSAPGTEQQVFGETMPPQWKLDMKAHKLASRTKCRIAYAQKTAKQKWWKYFL